MAVNKYLAALLALAITLLTAWQAIIPGGVDLTEGWQFAAFVVATVGTVALPLLEGRWAAVLKVSINVAAAFFAAVIPFATGGWTDAAAVIVGLAVLQAIAVQVGVSVRLASVASALTNPEVPNRSVVAGDAPAVTVAIARGVAPRERAASDAG